MDEKTLLRLRRAAENAVATGTTIPLTPRELLWLLDRADARGEGAQPEEIG